MNYGRVFRRAYSTPSKEFVEELLKNKEFQSGMSEMIIKAVRSENEKFQSGMPQMIIKAVRSENEKFQSGMPQMIIDAIRSEKQKDTRIDWAKYASVTGLSLISLYGLYSELVSRVKRVY